MSERYVIGADVGGTAVKYLVWDGIGAEGTRGSIPTDPRDAAATLRRLAGAIEDEIGAGVPRAVGIACAGIVDPDSGHLGRAPNLTGWQGRNLGAVSRRLWPGASLAFANDVNAAVVGEFSAGAGRGRRDLVMLALGTGVGGAVLVNGKLLTGGRFGAGELGHMVLDPDGPVCTCGSRGCLEAYAGAWALASAARETAGRPDCSEALREAVGADPEGPTPAVLAALAEAGDAPSRALYRRAGEMLGRAVGNLLNILDPDMVIIGGGVARAGDLLMEPTRRLAAEQVLCEAAKATPIVRAELGAYAAAVGAAVLAAAERAESQGSEA